MHRYPLPRRRPALVHYRTERSHKTATQAGGGGEVKRLRQWHQVDVRPMDRYILGKRTPVGEAGLKLCVADLVVARMALGADAAPTHKGNGNAVSPFPLLHVFANGLN